ncbi:MULTISPECIES: ABC transporter substrate-binding protein [Microbacterium]|uniref:ABC transporter substrate-binding protein n=1 Tax=Microbacterium TaxID=33882 RepID=UPI0023DB1CDF|nr:MULTISPECIES: ABC transporter substrate-binding protein [Microbacterium]MDF2045681.1 ABC transporter substrate-binding protein [Microbacterium sp. Kw_RZR3]MDQ1074922.1 NitT/TauT family transport system substrate-binding protein [Microbacterium sp. SORGH_AS_0969]MDQ1115147.1 NitT/TauT family transport system substrate-binding protein [Microbacterium testaceum]
MFRSTRFPRALAAVGFAAAAAVALAACSGPTSASSDGTSDETVGMAIQPWLGYGPWYIAQEKGYFRDQGVDVKITNFSNDADMSAAFASHRVQVANVASHSALKLKEQGLDISIVLLLDASLTADAILSDGGITKVADLAGQRVAFEEGSVSNLLLGYALDQSGLSLSDITPVPMDPSEAATALVGGSVPVAVTYEPYISEAQQASGALEKIFTAGEKPGLISDVLVVDNGYLKDHPDAVQKVVNAWGPAVSYYESNAADARSIIATNVGSDVEALTSAFDGVEFFPLDDNKTRLVGDYATSVLPTVQDIAMQIGLLKGDTDLAELIDSTFVENAP